MQKDNKIIKGKDKGLAYKTPYVQGLEIFSWIFIIIFFLSSIAGIGTENPSLIAMGTTFFGFFLFCEMLIIRNKLERMWET